MRRRAKAPGRVVRSGELKEEKTFGFACPGRTSRGERADSQRRARPGNTERTFPEVGRIPCSGVSMFTRHWELIVSLKKKSDPQNLWLELLPQLLRREALDDAFDSAAPPAAQTTYTE